MKRIMARAFKSEVDDKAEAILEKVSPGLKDAYSATQRLYGSMVEAKKTIQNKLDSVAQNRITSPSDHAVGLIGAIMSMLGGVTAPTAVINALLLSQGHKLVREHGAQVAADLANRAANILRNNPNALGRFVEPLKLEQAAMRSPAAFALMNKMLYESNPEYRAIMDKEQNDQFQRDEQ